MDLSRYAAGRDILQVHSKIGAATFEQRVEGESTLPVTIVQSLLGSCSAAALHTVEGGYMLEALFALKQPTTPTDPAVSLVVRGYYASMEPDTWRKVSTLEWPVGIVIRVPAAGDLGYQDYEIARMMCPQSSLCDVVATDEQGFVIDAGSRMSPDKSGLALCLIEEAHEVLLSQRRV